MQHLSYRDEVSIHAHVFYALVVTATNHSFRSASLHIVHMNLVPLNFGSEHLVLLCSDLNTSTEKPAAAADSRSGTPAVGGRLQGGVRAALSLREVSLRNAQSAHTGQLVAAMPPGYLACHNRPQRSGRILLLSYLHRLSSSRRVGSRHESSLSTRNTTVPPPGSRPHSRSRQCRLLTCTDRRRLQWHADVRSTVGLYRLENEIRKEPYVSVAPPALCTAFSTGHFYKSF